MQFLPEKSSFLNMCACSMPHTFLSSYLFLVRQLITFSVWGKLCCACQGEESSKIFVLFGVGGGRGSKKIFDLVEFQFNLMLFIRI